MTCIFTRNKCMPTPYCPLKRERLGDKCHISTMPRVTRIDCVSRHGIIKSFSMAPGYSTSEVSDAP